MDNTKTRSQIYYQKHKEEIKQKRKLYYQNNKNNILLKNKEYYENNKDSIKNRNKNYYNKHQEECLKRNNSYYINNKESLLENAKKYYEDNKDIIVQKAKQYRDSNKEIISKRRSENYKIKIQDPLYKFIKSTRNNIYGAFKRSKNRKNNTAIDILGCSLEEFKEYISSKFREGMSFANYGEWHLDHIIPISSASSYEEAKALCHYTNYQPLWAKDNLSKGAKILK